MPKNVYTYGTALPLFRTACKLGVNTFLGFDEPIPERCKSLGLPKEVSLEVVCFEVRSLFGCFSAIVINYIARVL